MNRTVLLVILPAILLLIDYYVFQAVKTLSRSATESTQRTIALIYWGFTAVSLLAYVVMQLLPPIPLAVVPVPSSGLVLLSPTFQKSSPCLSC